MRVAIVIGFLPASTIPAINNKRLADSICFHIHFFVSVFNRDAPAAPKITIKSLLLLP